MKYVVLCHLSVTDKIHKKEIHCEDVALSFLTGESRWLRGHDRTYYDDHADILYWLKANANAILSGRGFENFKDYCLTQGKEIFKKFEKLETELVGDAVVLETKEFQSDKEARDYIASLNPGVDKIKNTVYENEFN